MKNKIENMSLKSRIGLSITFVTFIVISVISIVTYFEFKEALFIWLENELCSDMQSIVGLASSDDSFDEIRNEVGYYFSTNIGRKYAGYKLWFDDGTVISESESVDVMSVIKKQNLARAPEISEYVLFDMTIGDKDCKAIWARYWKQDIDDGSVLNVIIALNSRHVKHEIAEFLRMLLILGGLSIWGAVGIAMLFIRWGLEPINDVTKEVQEITSHKLINPDFGMVQRANCPEELMPFIVSIDQMFNRISEFIRQQRQFTGDASHELRTPLAIIKSSLQVALSKERNADYYKDVINGCLEDIARMESLIEQLLELAKIDSGAVEQTEEIDLKEIAEVVCDTYLPFASEKQQRIICELESVQFVCDRYLISRMMSNLLMNAIKYSPPEKNIVLSLKKDNGYITFTVHDSGGRLNKSEFDKIFDRFYRSDKARSRKMGGSGLGLAIVKEIVNLYNGTIEVQSEIDKGTDFIIKFCLL